MRILDNGGLNLKKRKFVVPANFAVRWELVEGFGKEELKTTIIFSFLALVVVLLSKLIFKLNYIVCMLMFVFLVGVCIIFIKKLDNGISILDYYKTLYKYNHSQQNFMYEYMEEKR